MDIKLGSVVATSPSSKKKRFSLMLWGRSGCGKTTLASTAPGKKLWISFDPDGTDCLANRGDIIVLDYEKESASCTEEFKKEDGVYLKQIKKILEDHPEIETIVFDSVTTFGEKALTHGVSVAQGTAKGQKEQSSIESPGYSGYGNKYTWTKLCVRNLLALTGKLDRHIIFISHEDNPEKNKEGVILFITILLGSSLNNEVPIYFSEVWNLSITDSGDRRIAVRPCRFRTPMKSRMFISSGEPEFTWQYDADKLEGVGISDWYRQWSDNNGKKIELPT